MSRAPAKIFNLKPVPTEELLAELSARGIRYEDLPWEDCGECVHVAGMRENSRKCGAGRVPTWFPDGPGGDGNPHEVGFYTIQCPARRDALGVCQSEGK